jgi:hypothetical protein
MGVNSAQRGIVIVLFLCLPILGRALEVSPDFFQFKGVPKAHLKALVTLVNDSTENVEVRLELQGSAVKGEKSWITVSPRKLKISAGKSRVAHLSVRVPQGRGERVAQVWARSRGPMSFSEIRLIRKINLIIAGTEKYALSFDSIKTVDQGDRVDVDAVFRNEGNVTVHPRVGVALDLPGGTRASAYQETPPVSVAPGGHGSARVVVPLSGNRWEGKGTVTVYSLTSAGETQRVDKRIGD